jgi:hypothetical protein
MKVSRIAIAVIAALGASVGWAAGEQDLNAQARYQKDRAACLSGQSGEDQSTCLREAGAALADSRKGKLDDRGENYELNAEQRCMVLPQQDHQTCVRRMREGTVSGSVEGGGILRAYREIVPAPANPPPNAATPMDDDNATSPRESPPPAVPRVTPSPTQPMLVAPQPQG